MFKVLCQVTAEYYNPFHAGCTISCLYAEAPLSYKRRIKITCTLCPNTEIPLTFSILSPTCEFKLICEPPPKSINQQQ
jgi:hypothetical protein